MSLPGSKRSRNIHHLKCLHSTLFLGPLKHGDDRKETGRLAFFSFLLNFVFLEWEGGSQGPQPHKRPVSGLGELWEVR